MPPPAGMNDDYSQIYNSKNRAAKHAFSSAGDSARTCAMGLIQECHYRPSDLSARTSGWRLDESQRVKEKTK